MEKNIKLAIVLIFVLILISLATKYYGSVDVQEYVGVAKFFAGLYKADIRASHSLLYGFLHFPLIALFQNFFIMKIISLLFLIAIIISIYYISNKDKKTLLLIIASPIIWYTAPWINSISISSLFFLWGYFFLNKHEQEKKTSNLIFSGLFIGLSLVFWSTIIFILPFLFLVFFFDKKIYHFLIFFISILLGLFPSLLFDQIMYNLFFYSTLKHIAGNFSYFFYGGVEGVYAKTEFSVIRFIPFLLACPIFFHTLFSKQFFNENKRQVIFLTLVFLFFLFGNPQVRYILIFWPILILLLSKSLNQKQFKTQLIIFSIISLIVIVPYILQIKYSTNTPEFSSLFSNFGNWKIIENKNEIILKDLKQITSQYPNQIFLIGSKADDYALLAFLYWQDNVKEFVSIQDYNMFFENKQILFSKTIESKPIIKDRRQLWIEAGMKKSDVDTTDYESIELAISIEKPLNLHNFELVKKYNLLYLYKKIEETG